MGCQGINEVTANVVSAHKRSGSSQVTLARSKDILRDGDPTGFPALLLSRRMGGLKFKSGIFLSLAVSRIAQCPECLQE